MQFCEVYSFFTSMVKSRRGTLFCRAETRVKTLYVEPAPAAGLMLTGSEVSLRFFWLTPYLLLTPRASTRPSRGSTTSITAMDFLLSQRLNGSAFWTLFCTVGLSVV